MTLPDSDRATSRLLPSNGLAGSKKLEATTSFLQLGGPARTEASSGDHSTLSRRIDFLAPPQADGELGWLAHYRIRSLIGEGGVGLVFLAEDTQLSRPVALKVIKPELAGAPSVRSRFVREARAAAAIKHDHIVTIYHVGRYNDILFLAMEYLRGLSLQSWLERGRKPSTEVVLRIGREIAYGLAAAHRNGLVHRDIKPANIWLEAPSGRVKILDFGMARSERDDVQITQTGTVLGSPAYMAPEQARGETASAGSDLFSLGCVMYRLCAGRLPFEGKTIMAVLSALASGTPRSLQEVEPRVRPALDELVMGLLAKDPSARPASALSVVETIQAIERELLMDRQRANLSDDSHSPAVRAAVELPAIVTARETNADQAATHVRRQTLRAVAALAVLITTVGIAVIAQTRPQAHHAALRQPILAPAPNGPERGAAVAANEKAALPPQRVGHDSSGPEFAGSPDAGNASAALNGVPSPGAAVGSHQTSRRHDASEQPPAEVRSNDPNSQRPGKAVKDQPAAGSPASGTATTSIEATESRNDWGTPTNPDGDCTFELDRSSSEIKIAVPGTPHLLSAEIGRLNAPRLLQPIRGDFDVTVRVTGVFHPAGRATVKEYAPYHGAGLLFWQDERNYVRLEIATDIHHGKPRSYANFELRKDGELVASNGLDIKNGSTHLLLQRRGKEVRAAFGPDGVRWTWFSPLPVELDDRLSLGIAAINSAKKPLKAGFELLTVKKRSQAGDRGRQGIDMPRQPGIRPSP